VIFLISASQVARITGVSHWHLVPVHFAMVILEMRSSEVFTWAGLEL
jgi:hypothetical protein